MPRVITLLPVLTVVAAVFGAQLTDRGAKVSFFVGKVTVKEASGKEWKEVKINMKLSSGDALRTLAESRVDVETPEGTVINVMANTVLEAARIQTDVRTKADITSLFVKSGAVRATVKKLSGGRSRFEFETATARAVIRGTELEIEAAPGFTRVRVKAGEVEVSSKAGGRPALVFANQQALVSEGKPGVTVESAKPAAAEGGAEVALDIASPADGAAVVAPVVPFSGRTEPGALIRVNGVLEVKPGPDGAFSGSVTYPEGLSGPQPLVFAAVRGGRTSAKVLKITLGAAPASAASAGLVVVEPIPEALVTARDVRVSGSALPGAVIRLSDGQSLTCGKDGRFSGVVKLPSAEAGRYDITVTAELKNAAQTVTVPVSIIEVLKEMMLIINRPLKEEEFTRRYAIPVEGVTLPRARVVFGSGVVVTADSGGFFKGVYQVPERFGTYELSITSSAGGKSQKASVTIKVIAGAAGCPVDIVEPASGAEVPASFEVRGRVDNTDGRTLVTVNGVSAQLSGNTYSARINTGFRSEQGARVSVSVTSPAAGAVITQLPVVVRGRVTPPLARVLLDGRKQAKVLSDGTFEAEVPMPDEPGDYSVEVAAVMAAGEVILKPYDVTVVSECNGLKSAPVKATVNVNVGAAPVSGEARTPVAFKYEKPKYDLILMVGTARSAGDSIEIEVSTNAAELKAGGRAIPLPGPGGALRQCVHRIDNTDASCVSGTEAVFTAADPAANPPARDVAVPLTFPPVNRGRPLVSLADRGTSDVLEVTVTDPSFECAGAREEVTAVVEASTEGRIAELTFARNGQTHTVAKAGGVGVRYTVRAVDRGGNASTAVRTVPAFITGLPRITILSPPASARALRPGEETVIAFRIDDVDNDDARLIRRVEFRPEKGRPVIYRGAAIPPDLVFDDNMISCPAGAAGAVRYTIRVIDVRDRLFQLSGVATAAGR